MMSDILPSLSMSDAAFVVELAAGLVEVPTPPVIALLPVSPEEACVSVPDSVVEI